MASPEQLDGEQSPTIYARVEELSREGSRFGGRDFPHTAMLHLTIRGETVSRPISAAVRWVRGQVKVTAVGVFRFSEFGIRPFQTAFGLLRNDDKFHVYAEITAQAR